MMEWVREHILKSSEEEDVVMGQSGQKFGREVIFS